MGIFDKVKEMNETYKENTKERKEREKTEKEQKLAKKTSELIETYDIYKGIKFTINLPEKEIVLKQYGGLTKGLVTLAFGLPGYAATSGVKEVKKQKSITAIVQVVDAGVIFRNASEEGKDIRIPFESIVSFKAEKLGGKRINIFHMILTENQELIIRGGIYRPDKLGDEKYALYEYIEKSIDEKALGSKDPEEIRWSSNKNNLNSDSETKNDNDSLMDELERLGNMYERGLLTDDEFALAKKKLLEGD